MADRPRTNSALSTDHRPNGNNNPNNIIRRFHNQAPNSSQIIGLLTLAVSGSVLLLLTGVTVAASVLALLFFMPIILLSSPIWVPLATLFLLASAAFLSLCGFVVAAVAASSWLYRYLKGFNPPGAVRVDYARSRIYDTASHVKDYAKEYGGYLQSKVKDAAPGA